MQYHRENRRKYILVFHVIFVVKYRKKILKNELAETVKLSVLECASASTLDVSEMKVDPDHLYMMIDLAQAIR
jgi:putative transposase